MNSVNTNAADRRAKILKEYQNGWKPGVEDAWKAYASVWAASLWEKIVEWRVWLCATLSSDGEISRYAILQVQRLEEEMEALIVSLRDRIEIIKNTYSEEG